MFGVKKKLWRFGPRHSPSPGDKNGGVNMSAERTTVTPLPLTRVECQPVGRGWVGRLWGGQQPLACFAAPRFRPLCSFLVSGENKVPRGAREEAATRVEKGGYSPEGPPVSATRSVRHHVWAEMMRAAGVSLLLASKQLCF